MARIQYQAVALQNVTVDRDEDLIAHPWHRFLLWALLIGGISFLGWLVFGGYQWGYHANPCKPPCGQQSASQQPTNSKIQRDTSGLEKAAADLKSAADKLADIHTTATPVTTPPRRSAPAAQAFPSNITVETPGVERAANHFADAIRDSVKVASPPAVVQPAAQPAPDDSAAERARRLEEWSRSR